MLYVAYCVLLAALCALIVCVLFDVRLLGDVLVYAVRCLVCCILLLGVLCVACCVLCCCSAFSLFVVCWLFGVLRVVCWL